MEPNTLEERCNWQHRIISWLSIVGSLTVLGAFLSLLGEIPGFKGYYLFEWLILPSSPTGYFVAIGIATVCQLLPRGLPWWRMALAGAGTGAVFGVLGGLFYHLIHEMGLSSLNLLFLALSGAVPGLVITTIYSSWLAMRGLRLLYYIGAALIAGSIITGVASVLLLLFGTWRISPALPEVIGKQFWLVPTIFSVLVMTTLFIADLVHLHLTTPDAEPAAQAK